MQAASTTTELLGMEFFVGDVAAASRVVMQRALGGEGGYACLCNAHTVSTAWRDDRLRAALAGAWARFPGGASVAWLQRRLTVSYACRVAGPDLMPLVFAQDEQCELRHFLFGGTDEVRVALEHRIRERFPTVRIVGSASPIATSLVNASQRWLSAIRESEPHIVWCGLGAPKQELWMAKWGQDLRPAILLGVGAAFDFTAGGRAGLPRGCSAWGSSGFTVSPRFRVGAAAAELETGNHGTLASLRSNGNPIFRDG